MFRASSNNLPGGGEAGSTCLGPGGGETSSICLGPGGGEAGKAAGMRNLPDWLKTLRCWLILHPCPIIGS